MSEYFLADRRADERAKQRAAELRPKAKAQPQQMKATQLGDFAIANEGSGFDPYNSTQGKAPRELWANRRERR